MKEDSRIVARCFRNIAITTVAAGLLLSIAGYTPAEDRSTATASPPLSALVSLPPSPEGAPALEDISLSSRWPRPMNATDPHDAIEALEAFHAVRLDWCYTGRNKAFVEKAKAMGVPVFGTINAELTDGPGFRTRELGRDRNLRGEQIGNPELAQFVARGDVASEDFRGVVLAHCKAMLDAGVSGIHVDDPGMTYHGALWAEAGYGEASLAKFRAYLAEHTTAAERKTWGLPEDLAELDYRTFALEQGDNLAPALRKTFLEFHLASLNDFYVWLRRAMDEHAGRRVPLSCNNGSNQLQEEWHVQNFDFWLGETGVAYGDPTALGIFAKTQNAERLGGLQLFSPPNDGLDKLPTREGYVSLTRRIIATSYACGSLTLVPWDVWRRGPDTPRFFGTREEFGDLFDLIHAHRALFAGRGLAYAAGPDMEPWSVDGLDYVPVIAPEGVFVAVRAVPGDEHAPVVVHLVDWREEGKEVRVALYSGLLAGRTVALVAPKRDVQVLVGGAVEDGYVGFELGRLAPSGLLVLRSEDKNAG